MKKLFIIAQFFFLTFAFYSLGFSQLESNTQKYIYVQPTRLKNFINKLNELGKLGYKLKFVERNTEFNPPENPYVIEIAGILELQTDESFEYAWIVAETVPELEEPISTLGKSGFYFNSRLGYSLIESDELPPVTAEPGTSERDKQIIDRSLATIKNLLSTEPVDGNIFILEKNGKISVPVEFRIATAYTSTSLFKTSVINWNKVEPTLEDSMREIDRRRFYPVSNFYSSKIFLSRVPHLPVVLFQSYGEESKDNPVEYKPIVVFNFIGKFKEKLNLLAQGGANILVVTDKFALTSEVKNRKVSYHWIEPKKKDFLKTLAKISNEGGRFVANQETSMFEPRFIFEKLVNDDGQRFDYKVLTLTKLLTLRGNNDSTQEFNELINQGFQPRALFYNEGMNVLFEKPKN